MITFVTAFLRGESLKHRPEEYLKWFLQLADTGVPIVLFLDARTGWTSFPHNVHVVHTTLADTWIGNAVPTNASLPTICSSTDTREYMMIQTTKTEFVLQASQTNPFHTEWFAWIDFGIGHVFRDPDTTFRRIRDLTPPSSPRIYTAGIWRHTPDNLYDKVCWRFAGGFFLAHTSRIAEFDGAVRASVERNLPQFAWEVNVWADVERNGLDIGWFPSDHNDSIIPSNDLLRLLDRVAPHSEHSG